MGVYLMRDSKAEPSIFIQFAGQGVKYMDALRGIYTMYPDIRPFINAAISEIKRQASGYDDSCTKFFEKGLDVDQWILAPEKTPDLSYLLSSPVSHPLVYLTQIAGYLSMVLEGMDQTKLLANTHSATGFSTGIVTAILVSLGLPFDSLCREAIKVQAMFFWQGVRCQESMLMFGVNPKLSAERYDSTEGSPSCMASITNFPRSRLDEAISLFSDRGAVYPAYELLPGWWIVAGLPDTLEVFNLFIKEKYRAHKSVWRFIPSTIGAHSPFLARAYAASSEAARALGIAFSGRDMKIPVWSNDAGEDVRNADNIIEEVMQAYLLHPSYFRKQIKPVLPPTQIRYVLDFGPGTGVASLTENFCAHAGVKVIRCTIPLGRKRLFKEVLPGL
jgi:fatty acid synthase subunit beta, fungi type